MIKFCRHIDIDKIQLKELRNDIYRGFTERQILKKWKWHYLLNWVEYFDKLLRKHWYWQDLAQEIEKWHFSLVEAFLSSKVWKSDNIAISWT